MNEVELWSTNMHPESYLKRDRLTMRNTNIRHTEKVGEKKASAREVEQNPEKFYPQWYNPDRNPYLPSYMSREQYQKLRQSLHDLSPRLEPVWHPLREVWQVYRRQENIQSWWTKGWYRLFMITPGNNIAEKMKAKLYFMEPELFGRAKVHADRILYEKQLDDERFDKQLDDDAAANAREIYWKQLPKNIGKGDMVARQYE